MKKITCLIIFSIVTGFFFIGCEDPPPSAWDNTINALINDGKAWKVDGGMVSMDGSDVTESFANFEIIFTNETYSSTGGGDVWPDGTGVQWIFKGEDPNNASTIIRIDQVQVLIVVTKGDQLNMDFTVPEPGMKTKGLSGNYNFNLKSE